MEDSETAEHGGGRLSKPADHLWLLQLNSATKYCGPTYHQPTGTEVATKPIHQHVTAEGLCD